jgi:hypothetical protein
MNQDFLRVDGYDPRESLRVSCGTCVHFFPDGKDSGSCDRFPPQFRDEKDKESAWGFHWPRVWAVSVCGEWKAKE